jgi:hypothetical protein
MILVSHYRRVDMRIHDAQDEPKDYCRKCETKMLRLHQVNNDCLEYGSEHLDYEEYGPVKCDNCEKLLTWKDA